MLSQQAIQDALVFLDERALQLDLPFSAEQRAAVHAVYWAVSQFSDRMDAGSLGKLQDTLSGAESLVPENLRQNVKGDDVAEYVPSLFRLANQVIVEHAHIMTTPIAPGGPPAGKIVVELDADEAMVLFETLYRMNATSKLDDAVAQQVLNDLESRLEKLIPEVLGDNYKETLKAHREHYARRAVAKR